MSDAAEVPCAGPLDCGWGALQAQENQSSFVQKKVQLGDSSPDALSHHSTLCKQLHESFGCSRHSTFVRVNEFHSFIVGSDYLFRSVAVGLVKARNSSRRPSRSRRLKKSKAPALIQVTEGSSGSREEMKCRKILSCAGAELMPAF